MSGSSGMAAGDDEDLDALLDSTLDDFSRAAVLQKPSPPLAPSSEHHPSSATASSSLQSARGVSSDTAPSETSLAPRDEIKELGLGLGLGAGLPAKGRGKKKQKGAEQTIRESEESAGEREGSSRSNAHLRAVQQLAEETKLTVEQMEETSGEASEGDLEAEDEVLQRMLKQFEEMGSTQDVQGLVDSMMRQLLSKEVLYEPMKEIAEKYPDWLASHKQQLSTEEVERYENQLGHIQRLCQVFEQRPDDFSAIIDIMQQMQSCGQPPAELMKELAPGLELGEDGLPMMPDLLGGPNPENCKMM